MSAVGRTIIGDPKYTAGSAIWLLLHYQINQVMKAVDSGGLAAKAEKLTPVYIPCSHVGQGTFSFVFMLDSTCAASRRCGSGRQATASLNAGFLIGTDHVVAGAKGFALPCVMIKIKDTTGFCFEILIPGPNPTAVTPWADRIGAEPAPYGSSADGGHNAAFDGLPCDFITGKARERKSQILGQLTCQRFDLYHDFRGEKSAGARAVAVHRDRPSAVQRSVSSILRRSDGANRVADRSACWIVHRLRGG